MIWERTAIAQTAQAATRRRFRLQHAQRLRPDSRDLRHRPTPHQQPDCLGCCRSTKGDEALAARVSHELPELFLHLPVNSTASEAMERISLEPTAPWQSMRKG